MNRKEIVNMIADIVSIKKTDIEAVIRAFENVVKDRVMAGEIVSLSDFGKFEKKIKKGRTGVINMGEKKGQTYTTEDTYKASFNCSKAFTNMLNA